MADPLDKELKAPDAEAAALQPTKLDPSGDSDEDRIDKNEEKDLDEEKRIDDSSKDESRGPELREVRTAASAATTATRATTQPGPPEKKPWHKNLNPLRWGSLPPVPPERMASREYQAGFFSMLTFQWMAPLMTVSFLLWQCRIVISR